MIYYSNASLNISNYIFARIKYNTQVGMNDIIQVGLRTMHTIIIYNIVYTVLNSHNNTPSNGGVFIFLGMETLFFTNFQQERIPEWRIPINLKVMLRRR